MQCAVNMSTYPICIAHCLSIPFDIIYRIGGCELHGFLYKIIHFRIAMANVPKVKPIWRNMSYSIAIERIFEN